MGLFSPRIRTQVSSVVYNLAGDENSRPDYLQTLVIGSTLSRSGGNISDNLMNAYLSGPGMNQRRFFTWSRDSNLDSMPTGTLGASSLVEATAVVSGITSLITLLPDQQVRVLSARIDDADIDYWAEDGVRVNYPSYTENDWSADYDKVTNEIVIQLVNGDPDVRLAATADLLWGLDRTADRKLLFASYTILTVDTSTKEVSESSPALFVYQMGSGTVALDTLANTGQGIPEFFPALALRINNASIRDEGFEDTYAEVKEAYRKLTNDPVDTLLDSIEENEDIADVDFAFLVQGVSLNVENQDCKGYLYDFFRELMNQQATTKQDFTDYTNHIASQYADALAWNRWIRGNSTSSPYHPMRGSDQPGSLTRVVTLPTTNELQIRADSLPDFDYRIRWAFIDESVHHGNAKTFDAITNRGRAKVGEYWFHPVADLSVSEIQARTGGREHQDIYTHLIRTYPRMFMFHQYARYKYKRLELVGLEHKNFVYNGYSVTTTSREAMEDVEESPFIVPLHYPTLTGMSLKRGTQMSTANTFVVFNCYKEVRQRWYETGIFRVILIIVAIVASVVFPPLGGGLFASGILGSSAALGASLGIASAGFAAIVGAITNVLASVVVTTLISDVSTQLFGDKIGAIIGTIISFVAMTYATQFAQTGNFAVDWGQMMQADNLTRITNSVSDAYTQWMAADTAEIFGEMETASDGYREQMENIQQMTNDILGMTNVQIDPMMYTDATEYFEESSESFLTRTMLTGTDIAELTHAMIRSFVPISLELPRAII